MKGREVLAEAMRRAGRDEEFIQFALQRMDLEMPSLANEEVSPEDAEEQIKLTIEGHDKIVKEISPDEIHQAYEEAKKGLSSSN